MNPSVSLTADGFNELKRCRYGYMLYNKYDQYIGRSFQNYGEFSEGETELFRQFIRPGMLVLDIGANIGAHTLFFAQQVTSAGAVFAFEPQRLVYQTLCANMALNSIANVWCLHSAVSSQNGNIIVPHVDYHQKNNFGGLSLGQAQQGENVAVIAIDQLQLSRCDFMKIDVEGMEREVIQGAKETIRRFRPIIYAENDRQEKSAALIQAIRELNYKLYWHLPSLYNPDNFLKNADNVFDNIISVNMLCVSAESGMRISGLREVSGPDDAWQT